MLMVHIIQRSESSSARQSHHVAVAVPASSGKPHELLADLPELLGLLRIAGLLRQLVLERRRVLVPAPVHPRLGEAGVADHLRQPLAGLRLRHEALGDELLERREEQAEQRDVLAEQPRGGDAPRVERRERDARLLVVPPVQLLHGEHVADLAVLVRLGAVEALGAVDHGRAVLAAQPRREAAEVAQPGLGRDVPGQRVGVAGDGAEDDEAAGRVVGLLHVVQEQARQEEVAQVVDADAHLVSVRRERRRPCRGPVDGGVADERVERHAGAPEAVHELPHAVEGGQVQVHDGVAAVRHAGALGRLGRLEEVAAGHHHVPLAGLRQRLGRRQAQPRRRARDHHHALPHGLLPILGRRAGPRRGHRRRRRHPRSHRQRRRLHLLPAWHAHDRVSDTFNSSAL
uniref:Uncharacterized protein n=1 Tax=Zea mays TaxID=4577 RepID=C4JBC6_MAIZE|nr:unknown [Zea mays]